MPSIPLLPKPWQGYTLLELLFALSLGLLIIYALFSLHHVQHTSLKQWHSEVRRAEAGFMALHLMSAHLRLTGFVPPFHIAKSQPLFGCSAGRPAGPMGHTYCKPDSVLHSDGLEVGYVVDQQTWGGKLIDCLGQELSIRADEHTTNKKTPFPGRWSVQRFFTQKSPSTGHPELYCEGSGRLGSAQPIVEGIEYLQVRYRLANTNKAVEASALAPHQWAEVTAVELCVVARDVLQHALLKTPSYIDCNGLRRFSSDKKQRTAFTTQVALQNSRP